MIEDEFDQISRALPPIRWGDMSWTEGIYDGLYDFGDSDE